MFFEWFVALEGRKVGSLKRMKGEKLHAVVARSTFWRQKCQNTPFSEHFWKLRCWKSARRCGAKHMLKSKVAKHVCLGRLLEVEMSKKCALTSKWTHTKHRSFGRLLEIEMLKKCTALWWETHSFASPNLKNTWGSDRFFTIWFSGMSKKCTPLWRQARLEVKRVKDWGFEPFRCIRCPFVDRWWMDIVKVVSWLVKSVSHVVG